MTQQQAFGREDFAPAEWVDALMATAGAGAGRWQDGSWGNDAAPSWQLVTPDGVVQAQAFYYTPDNAERYVKDFGPVAYVSLLLYRDEEIAEAWAMEPETFLLVAKSAAAANYGDPLECLGQALYGIGKTYRVIQKEV
jgi:hypothetical protein